jgi:hypothetical protein
MVEEPNLHIVGVPAAGPHQESGDFAMLAGLVDGTTAVLRVRSDILSGLSLPIRNHLSRASHPDGNGMVSAKPMDLYSCQPFSIKDGKRLGMVMDVEHLNLAREDWHATLKAAPCNMHRSADGDRGPLAFSRAPK